MVALSDQQIIERLRQWGHLWHVDQIDLPRLTLQHEAVRSGIRSLQGWMPRELDTLAGIHHGRPAIHDGDVGPATRDLFGVNRCPMPDNPPPPGATFDYGDETINAAVARMQASAATGSGSWPANCHEDIARGHVVTFHVDARRAPHGREAFNAPLNMCIAAYKSVGVLMHEVDDPDYADIHVSFRSLRGPVGLAEFNAQSCRDTVFCYLDPSYWPNVSQVARLLLHEWGHNNNLRHTRGGVMHPSMLAGFPGWRTNDPSWGTLKRFFGGVPFDTEVKPDPDPSQKTLTGVLRIDGYEDQPIAVKSKGGGISEIEW